jgi:hypothetical protein
MEVSLTRFDDCYCLQAKRGGLANTPADDLLAALFKATFTRTGVDPADVGDVVIGSVLGPSSQRANEARIAMFLAGMPETVPVHTVNRCAGFLTLTCPDVRRTFPATHLSHASVYLLNTFLQHTF